MIWVDPRTAVRAWCMSGDPNCRNPPWTEATLNDEKKLDVDMNDNNF